MSHTSVCYICLRASSDLESCCTVCNARVHSECWKKLALSARLTQLKYWLSGSRSVHARKIQSLAVCPICRSSQNVLKGEVALLPEQQPLGVVQEVIKLSRLASKQEFLTASENRPDCCCNLNTFPEVQVDLSCITMVCGCIGTTADVLWYLIYPNTHWTLVVIPTLAIAYVIIVVYLLGCAVAQRNQWLASLPTIAKPKSVEYVLITPKH